MRRWTKIALGAGILMAVGATWAYWSWTRGGLPIRGGELVLQELEAPVEVRFDGFGVPHVTAGSARDLATAMGWLHANDRMFQLELLRRAGSGRLSELVGASALERDLEARTLRFRRSAQRTWEVLESESRELLEAYAAGVNAWIDEQELPPSLRLLGVELETWTPVDSLLTHYLMARDLTYPRRYEERRFSWLVTLGKQRMCELLGRDVFVSLELEALAQSERAKIPAGEGSERIRRAPGSTWSARMSHGAGRGSNSWAVGPSRSATGSPIVANDPHLSLAHPGFWYQALLRAPDYEACGMTLPGLPMVVIGQNRDLAWSFTNSEADVTDLFFEEMNEEGDAVKRGEEWLPVRSDVETIVVRDSDDVTIELRSTDIGPLLEAGRLGFAYSAERDVEETRIESEPTLPERSLAWTAYEPFDPIDVFLRLGRATSAGEAEHAIEGFICPVQNIVVGTREGELLQAYMGRLPRRRQGAGVLPGFARDPEAHWDGLLPRSAGPLVRNPPAGRIVTANSDTRPDESVDIISGDFATSHRRDRIRGLLAERELWDVEGFTRLQLDNVSLYAAEWIQRLGALDESSNPAAESARRTLAAWDGSMDERGPAALFALFDQELTEALSMHLYYEGQRPLGYPDRIPLLLRFADGSLPASWSDIPFTEDIESPERLLEQALQRAWNRAVERFGTEPADFDHGAMHTWTPYHPMGVVPILGALFRRGPFPVPGSSTTVAVFTGPWTRTQESGPFIAVIHGASMRWVADVANPDRSRAVLPVGQSAHPFDPHYDDQLPLFLSGETRAVAWTRRAIEASTVSLLRLVP